MADVLPVTISGWELEIQEKLSELIRTADDELQGLIKWKLNKSRGFSDKPESDTVLMGEDEAGRLIFLAQDVPSSCIERTPGISSHFAIISWVNNRGGVQGSIELPANQFGPSTKYKIGLTVVAKASAGIIRSYNGASDLSPPECKFFNQYEHHVFYSIKIYIINSDTFEFTGLAGKYGPSIDISHEPDREHDILEIVETDAIDFNALHPGQLIVCDFELWGKRITVEKVILTKKQF
jgi:hypothetical protein